MPICSPNSERFEALCGKSKPRMLLEQVLAELSKTNSSSNEEVGYLNIGKRHTEPLNSIPEEKISRIESNRNACCMSPELKLHLESNREFFNRLRIRKELADQNSEGPLARLGTSASIPFKWEEQPGRPKNLSIQEPTVALALPPVRHSSLNSLVGDSQMISNSPRTLSGRLRNILQAKFHQSKLSDPSIEENKGEQEDVSNEFLQCPEEFACFSQKDSSPVSIFEGPDSPSSSSPSLLSYCNKPSSSTRQNSVPTLLANCLIPMTEMLNAVPVDNSGSIYQKLPAPFISADHKQNSRSKMSRSSFTELFGPNRTSQGFMRLQSENVGNSPIAMRREPEISMKSARNSAKSVSWGATEVIGEVEFRQPIKMIIPEEKHQVKQGECHTIVDHKLSNGSTCLAVSTSVSAEVACRSAIPVSSRTSGSSLSGIQETNSSMKVVPFVLQPSFKSHPEIFRGIPRRNKYWDKVQKNFKYGLRVDSFIEDKRKGKLTGSCGKNSQKMAVQPKRWTFSLMPRMNIVSCCTPTATNTVNCYSSRNTAHNTINRSKDKNKPLSLSSHKKLQSWNGGNCMTSMKSKNKPVLNPSTVSPAAPADICTGTIIKFKEGTKANQASKLHLCNIFLYESRVKLQGLNF
eukprot:Gb_23456 [translate_table: standard]